MPVTFAGAESSKMSSMNPTRNTRPQAMTTPSGSELPANTAENRSSETASHIAARNPTNIARPPMTGVGCVWTRRSSGATTQPHLRPIQPTIGVRTNVTRAATPPTAM